MEAPGYGSEGGDDIRPDMVRTPPSDLMAVDKSNSVQTGLDHNPKPKVPTPQALKSPNKKLNSEYIQNMFENARKQNSIKRKSGVNGINGLIENRPANPSKSISYP